jgi:hypothetical protein
MTQRGYPFSCILLPEMTKYPGQNMMKPITLFILVFMIASAAVAQNNASRYRQYAGRYGGNSGICLFEDGGFMLYGYATAVFGKYIFEKDYLSFFPDQPELFEVYAHYNKALGDSTRINFAGFQEGRTFIQFNKQKPQRVFNEDANCFDAPFVYQGVQPLTSFTLSFIKESVWRDQGKGNPSWQYEVKSNYNDFIWIFNEPKREYENFSARLTAASGKTRLQLSNYGGNEGYVKQIPDKEEKQQWLEILEWKKQYDASKHPGGTAVFANKHYHVFPQPDSLNYIWDEASQQYISRQAGNNEVYYQNNQYNDDRFLRKYVKLEPQNKGAVNFAEDSATNNSIFYTICGEGSRPSYRYQGFVEYKDTSAKGTPLMQTAPAPPPEISSANIATQDHLPGSISNSDTGQPVILVKPFAVDRPDGFYIIEKKNNDDYTKTVLAAAPSLTPKDFEAVQYKTGAYDESIIEIRFTKTGTIKLQQFSSDQVGKQVALVANRKVIVMPFLAEPIKSGRIDIHWGRSTQEAATIAGWLQR